MKARRNEPCPCGSGRKYKACCQERDDAVERSLEMVQGVPAGSEPHWYGAAREAEHWEADVIPLGPAEDEPDELSLAMVVAAGYIVHGEVLKHTPEAPHAVAAEIAGVVKAAGRILGVLPGRLLVRGPEVAALAGRELRAAGTEVEAADELPELDPAAASALERLGRPERDLPVYTPRIWRGSGVPAADVAALFRAAAAFYRTAPWREMGDHDLLIADLGAGGEPRIVSVLGRADEAFGINLFAGLSDFAAMSESAQVGDSLRGFEHPVPAVLFSRRDELSAAMQREVADAGWEVAGPDAYPMVMVLNPGDPPLPAEEVRVAARVMEAVAALVEICRAGDAGDEFVHEPTGVALSPVVFSSMGLWAPMMEAKPNCAVGPRADPGAALGDPEAIGEAEIKRVDRFERFLRKSGLAESTIARHAFNAEGWAVFLQSYMGVPASAATEYDLRVFLYDWYPRKAMVDKQTARALPVSLKRLFRWMAERQGIAYPWAEAVLADRRALELRQETAPEPYHLDMDPAGWRGELYMDLNRRVMMHDAGLPGTQGGWPAVMPRDVALLERELERRWQIWRDEEVRGGVTDPEALRRALVRRQRAWERTPHPAFGGKTPKQVVAAAEKKARR